MPKLIAFNSVSVDGYIADRHGDMTWAKPREDAEWNAFVAKNASGGGMLLFGRVTYELMRSFWPTPQAAQQMPAVAERMNNLPKIVFSRTLNNATWNNTTLLKDDIAAAVRRMKKDSATGMTISPPLPPFFCKCSLHETLSPMILEVRIPRGLAAHFA